jgi:peptidoglycan LD-endopeptidase LytH
MTSLADLSAPQSLRAWLRQTAVTGAVALLAASILHVGAQASSAVRARMPEVEPSPLVEAVRASMSPPAERVLVWRGADLDADGSPDFVNPTGKPPRETDAYGHGWFGASRDGGSRQHEGVDFVAEAGQTVVAPISGYVTKIGYAYAGDPDLRFVEITNPALGHVARVFYVDPRVAVGQAVRLGAAIGLAHSLQATYPGGMTDHVHLEIQGPGRARFDATEVLTARYETRSRG